MGLSFCCFYKNLETIQHLFFYCSFAKFLWRVNFVFGISPLANANDICSANGLANQHFDTRFSWREMRLFLTSAIQTLFRSCLWDTGFISRYSSTDVMRRMSCSSKHAAQRGFSPCIDGHLFRINFNMEFFGKRRLWLGGVCIPFSERGYSQIFFPLS